MPPSDHEHPVNRERVAAARAGVLSVDDAGRLAGLLGMLADPVRSRILFALAAGEELCVGDLALALDVTEDQVSYALKMLRLAGLVSFRKDGRMVFYRLSDGFPHQLLEHCLRELLTHRGAGGGPLMRFLDALGHALGAGRLDDLAGHLVADPGLHLVGGGPGAWSAGIRSPGCSASDRPKALAVATGLGAASSSCSYAAVALARALFRRGANFTAAMAFEIASTNLVIELGIILALLISWQFTLAEFVGGPIMIVLMAVAFRLFVRARLVDAAREQADKGLAGSMEGHAAMDMSIAAGGSFWHRLVSRDGYTSVSHIFVMEWAAVIRDVVIGLLIAGAVGAWVPNSFWQHLFLTGHPLAAAAVGADHRPGHLAAQLRLLDRQRAAGRGAVERRDQLRRRRRVHLRRPDHHPDPDHLPEVLRHPDDAGPARDLLRDHGPGRLHRRVPVRRAGAHPGRAGRRRSPTSASSGTTPRCSTSSSCCWPRRCWCVSSGPAAARCSR